MPCVRNGRCFILPGWGWHSSIKSIGGVVLSRVAFCMGLILSQTYYNLELKFQLFKFCSNYCFLASKVPDNELPVYGCSFLPKWPLKQQKIFGAQAAHTHVQLLSTPTPGDFSDDLDFNIASWVMMEVGFYVNVALQQPSNPYNAFMFVTVPQFSL